MNHDEVIIDNRQMKEQKTFSNLPKKNFVSSQLKCKMSINLNILFRLIFFFKISNITFLLQLRKKKQRHVTSSSNQCVNCIMKVYTAIYNQCDQFKLNLIKIRNKIMAVSNIFIPIQSTCQDQTPPTILALLTSNKPKYCSQ